MAELLALLPVLAGPLRQPYFGLSQALRDDCGRSLPARLAEVRQTPPHDRVEYRLWRRVRDWETRDIRVDFTPLRLLLEDRRRHAQLGQGPRPEPMEGLD